MRRPFLNHNSVIANVSLAKQKVHPVTLELRQEYGDHHHFDMTLDYDMYGDNFLSNPVKHIELIGRLVFIRFKHQESSTEGYQFKGVVTSVRQTGREGKKGYLVVSGSSPTIMLEKGNRLDIYSNQSLYQITKQITDRAYSDYISFGSEPVYKNKIEFLMQYNESDWDFLKRIAYLYRENLYYSGHELLFGSFDDLETVALTYDREIIDLEFCSKLLATNFERYQYVSQNDTTIERELPKQIDNSNDFVDSAEEMSYNAMNVQEHSKTYMDAPVYTNSEVSDLLKREKSRNAAQTITIKGKSKTYKTTLGRVIHISIPQELSATSTIGNYRVIKSIHRIDENNRYSCEFEAVPASLDSIPANEPKAQYADSVVARVKSNEDPLNQGRVQVDFQFASNYNYSWLRVLTPNAGSSTQVSQNRGMVFVPEKGDQVMIGFEYGDPNRPYVMGSLFHGKNGKGGGQNNAEKSIITKSGVQIVFNDNQRSLHIQDPSGNTWDMDGQGNINVFAPKKIKFESEYIEFMATKDLNIEVVQLMKTNVYGKTSLETPRLEQNITDYFHAFGGQVLINSHNDIRIESPETYLVGERKLFAHSAESAIVNSGGTTQIIGANGTNHTNIASEYDIAKEKIEPKCIVSFRPHSQYDAEFGFDWFRMGDSGLSEDNPFKDIIGKTYEEDGETVLIDTNSYKGIFKQDQQMYEKALRDYKNMVVGWKSKPDDVYFYSPPYLSLLEGNTAKLKLVLEVEEVPTDAIIFEFEDKMGSDYFSLNVSEIKKANLKKGNYALDAYLSITATKECNKQQVLLAKAGGKVCGKLFIHANSVEYHKPIKVVFVKVETDIRGKDKKGEPIEGGYDFFKDCLHQAFVMPQDVCELAKLNCKSDPKESQFELRDTFCSKTKWDEYYLDDNRSTWGWELKEYLERVTVEQHGDTYDSYYRVYFLDEYLTKIGGFAFFNTQFGIYFKKHKQSYIAHELFHAMGLPHTFDGRNNNAQYTYKGLSTDNLLDYTHLFGTKTKTLFGWQMRLLNPKIGQLNLIENSDTKNGEYDTRE